MADKAAKPGSPGDKANPGKGRATAEGSAKPRDGAGQRDAAAGDDLQRPGARAPGRFTTPTARPWPADPSAARAADLSASRS